MFWTGQHAGRVLPGIQDQQHSSRVSQNRMCEEQQHVSLTKQWALLMGVTDAGGCCFGLLQSARVCGNKLIDTDGFVTAVARVLLLYGSLQAGAGDCLVYQVCASS